MNIDITPYIKELLFENNSLVIPGFGALTLDYAPSTIDYVQGLLNPPTKSINFDENLVVNDGKLVDIIQQKHQVSTEEANRQIDKLVAIMQDQLERREMVNIAGVGRLYKDFENSLQFIADSTNFNKDAFGLPTINFYPILRKKVAADTIIPRSNTIPSNKYSERKSFFEWFKDYAEENSWLPITLIATALIVTVGFIIQQTGILNSAPITDKVVNESPMDATANQETALTTDASNSSAVKKEATATDEDAIDYQTDEALANTRAEDDNIIDTESSTLSPNQNMAIVSVGIFGNKSNAQKRIEQVYEYGYDALPNKYIKNGKELTQIGIQFAFETEEEFEETIKHIKKKFTDAKVIRKE